MKFGICNETWQGWEFGRTCDAIAAAGYSGVEIAPFTLCDDPRNLTEASAAKAGAKARAAGLEVIGFHWLLVAPPGLHLTRPDPSVRRNTLDFARHLVRTCAAMEGNVMVWGSPKQRSIAPSEDREEATARAADLIREVCETAGPLGVQIAMEPLPATDTNFLTTAAETIEFIRSVNHPSCRLHLDVRAMSSETESIPRLIERSRPDLAHFHANDPNLRGPGFGETDFKPIAEALRRTGYEGYVSVEVFDYTPDADTIARQSIRYLREAFASAAQT